MFPWGGGLLAAEPRLVLRFAPRLLSSALSLQQPRGRWVKAQEPPTAVQPSEVWQVFGRQDLPVV